MKIYSLIREQYLPIPIAEAWSFFSSAQNLSKITPAGMNFVILTRLDKDSVYPGMKIDYRVSPLMGIPLRWTSEITVVNAPYTFTDKQLKGPYALWEHTHTFVTVAGGVKMIDDLKYALPFGFIGEIAHAALVKKKLEQIFNFRALTLENLFGAYKK